MRAVVDYSFGNYKYLVLTDPPRADGGLQARDHAGAEQRDELAIASFNVENLAADDPPAKLRPPRGAHRGRQPQGAGHPGLEEIQDNDGAAAGADGGGRDAHLDALIAAIKAAGGPTYQYRRSTRCPTRTAASRAATSASASCSAPTRGVSFVDRPGGTATNATEEVGRCRAPS